MCVERRAASADVLEEDTSQMWDANLSFFTMNHREQVTPVLTGTFSDFLRN